MTVGAVIDAAARFVRGLVAPEVPPSPPFVPHEPVPAEAPPETFEALARAACKRLVVILLHAAKEVDHLAHLLAASREQDEDAARIAAWIVEALAEAGAVPTAVDAYAVRRVCLDHDQKPGALLHALVTVLVSPRSDANRRNLPNVVSIVRGWSRGEVTGIPPGDEEPASPASRPTPSLDWLDWTRRA